MVYGTSWTGEDNPFLLGKLDVKLDHPFFSLKTMNNVMEKRKSTSTGHVWYGGGKYNQEIQMVVVEKEIVFH